MQPLPSLQARIVDAAGKLLSPWNSYLQQFTQAPPRILTLIVTASPFSYIAKEPGYISVADGVVSAIVLTRGVVVIDVIGVKLIPVSISDTVTVTYTGLPTVKFIPIYGSNTK